MTMALIPEPSGGLDYPVVDVCASIEVWAASTDDIAAIRATAHKLSAIDHYLEATSTEGRSAVAATLRHLEVRIGDLLGPATNEGPSLANDGANLTRNQRHECRQEAAHPEVVEEVIAASSDETPASRRAVLAAIREATEQKALLEAAAHYPFLANLPAPSREVIAMAKALDAIPPGREKDNRLDSAREWAAAKCRAAAEVAQRGIADDDPKRVRILASIDRWETCPGCAGKGMIRKENA